MKHILALLFIVTLTACGPLSAGNTKPLSQHQQIELVCSTVGTAYATTGELNALHPFSAATQDRLRAAAAKTDKTCGHIPYSWIDVVPGFSDAVAFIETIAKGKTP